MWHVRVEHTEVDVRNGGKRIKVEGSVAGILSTVPYKALKIIGRGRLTAGMSKRR